MDNYFIFNMIRNIISTFFQDGIWVVGFFYLLLKVFDSERFKQFSMYVIIVVLVLLLVYSIIVNV